MTVATTSPFNETTDFYRKTTLPNGVRIVTSPMNHVHSATIVFNYNVGSRWEAESQGIALRDRRTGRNGFGRTTD